MLTVASSKNAGLRNIWQIKTRKHIVSEHGISNNHPRC